MIDPQTTLARTVLDHSQCAAVFQRHRIDYCCKGERSIAEASRERGLDPAALCGELDQAIFDRRVSAADPRGMTTLALLAHIVAVHHAYLRQTLPFLRGQADKVARVHGERDPSLAELAGLIGELTELLIAHLDREELVLFPALLASPPERAIIAAELASMSAEHQDVGARLEAIRAFTARAIPEWACVSYRVLMGELERLDADVQRHVHLENHVLMPRFVQPPPRSASTRATNR